MSEKKRKATELMLATQWPDRQKAETARWFQPIEVGSVRLAERTWVPAMVPWRCTEDGFITPQILAWYGRFAAGQPGAIVVEATGIRDVRSGPLMRIGHDRYLNGLRELVETVRERSDGRTRLFIQLIDFLTVRRRPSKARYFGKYLPVDDVLRSRMASELGEARWRGAAEAQIRERLIRADETEIEAILTPRLLRDYRFGYRESVNDTHLPHVAELPQTLPGLFAAAADRARRAGFDGVELHFAHAYTMASFLSATNQRTDGYGGPRENRIRLPLEVVTAVRAAVGDAYPVGCRFLGDEVIEDGSHLDDAVYFGVELAKAGLDFLSVSKGGKFDDAKQPKVGEAVYPYTGPSGHECMPTVYIDEQGPFSRNVPLAASIRKAVREAGHQTPVVTAGGICTFDQAERILEQGEADIVASARQTLADPDWFKKVRLGRGDQVRRCLFTNYCESLDQRHKEVTCQLWDRQFDPTDRGVIRSADGRRRLVAPLWDLGDGGT